MLRESLTLIHQDQSGSDKLGRRVCQQSRPKLANKINFVITLVKPDTNLAKALLWYLTLDLPTAALVINHLPSGNNNLQNKRNPRGSDTLGKRILLAENNKCCLDPSDLPPPKLFCVNHKRSHKYPVIKRNMFVIGVKSNLFFQWIASEPHSRLTQQVVMSLLQRNSKKLLPSDVRHHLGGYLFLGSLFIFFLSSILLYGIYAYARRGDPQSATPIPNSFLISTVCLILISGLVHAASRMIRRDRYRATSGLLLSSSVAAIIFIWIQFQSMYDMLNGPALASGTGKGVAGMLIVLAFLHALHVVGGIIALAIVSFHSLRGRYDHERHWPVDFAAQYWHFLDIIWILMLIVFWVTTGGFDF